MKKSLLIVLLIVFAFGAKAQDYDMAIGLRLGLGSGLTFKKVISKNASFEALAEFRYGFNLTGLYEINRYDAFDVDRLNWYFGGGAHIGSYRGYRTRRSDFKHESELALGLDGIIGIEYNFVEAPINLSLDWKPTLNFVGYDGLYGDNGSLSVRYIF
ncbi:MAG: hypothetical protein ACI8XB_000224 [Patiriisocius sp.]|jgi:hypothetical protein